MVFLCNFSGNPFPDHKSQLKWLIKSTLNPGGNRTVNFAGLNPVGPLMALLASRTLLFLLFQAIIALILRSWSRSEGYWLVTATLTNFVSNGLLVLLFGKENESYHGLIRLRRDTL